MRQPKTIWTSSRNSRSYKIHIFFTYIRLSRGVIGAKPWSKPIKSLIKYAKTHWSESTPKNAINLNKNKLLWQHAWSHEPIERGTRESKNISSRGRQLLNVSQFKTVLNCAPARSTMRRERKKRERRGGRYIEYCGSGALGSCISSHSTVPFRRSFTREFAPFRGALSSSFGVIIRTRLRKWWNLSSLRGNKVAEDAVVFNLLLILFIVLLLCVRVCVYSPFFK